MPTSQNKPVDCSELAASLARLALAHGEADAASLDSVVDAIRKDLPEIDRDTITDAIVAYTARTRPTPVNKDEIKARIIELKKSAKMDSKLRAQINDLQKQLKTGDIDVPVSRAKKIYDNRIQELQFRRDKMKKEINRKIQDMKPASAFKTLVENPFNEFRALMTSGEFSAVGRQGGILSIANPMQAANILPKMLKGAISEKAAHKIDQTLRTGNPNSRPNALLYEKAGLHLPDPDIVDSPRSSEEAFQTNLPITTALSRVTHIPVDQIVHGSGRAYITYLNLLRADMFDKMTAGLAKNGEPDTKEAKAIADFINVATGRGHLGSLEKSISALNTIFFAPRYVASRFQFLSEPLRAAGATALTKAGAKRFADKQSLYGGTRETDKLIAKEYAKYGMGMAAILGIAALAGPELGVEVEKDPRSTDFLKLKIGNTRVDLLSGLQQAAVFIAKQASKQSKSTATGEVEDMDARRWLENATRFGRGKLSPLLGTALDLTLRQDVVGNQVAPLRSTADAAKFAGKLLLPITWKDIAKVLSSDEYGLPDKTALTVAAMLGAGIQNFDPSKPQPPDDRFTPPSSAKEAIPGLPNTIHLTDDQYSRLLQAHEQALAEIEVSRKAGDFKGLDLPAMRKAEKEVYKMVFDPAKEEITGEAIDKYDHP